MLILTEVVARRRHVKVGGSDVALSEALEGSEIATSVSSSAAIKGF
jgi:uncharacterized MnhB-related membrane protein